MKFRTLILVVFILMIAAMVALNFEEILRPTPLDLGVSSVEAPIGLVLLGLLTLVIVVFLVMLVFNQTTHLMEVRQVTREASEQRHLADKAEASRFVELREFMQTQLQTAAAREQDISNQLQQKMDAMQERLTLVIEQTGNGLGASLGELEDRLEQQFKRNQDS
ncbi:LapA family protein [Hydrogenophaga sp.]|uniref:LapA family protein n=1 Tax=Hydrogenophaga sp. TaxID=1904254 RepID=UPI0027231B92|nr:LapA family protein [Hydrogenophaga sp.]MDO8903272.1 LapA family protein [Hydrogenophaga sp.]